jgi:signal transduction histidine kinase
MGLGYRSLERENEARRTLIAELHRTQDELAVAEHGRGVLEERERLAREIHDTVAQGLASIVILLGATDQELRQGDHASALSHIAQARDTARHDLDEARRFVRELAPVALDGASLPEALEQLCAQTTRLGGPVVAFAVSGPPHALAPAHELALLRVAQSALANTVAHADAGQGRVTLTYLADGVALDIHDDGRGFDPTASRPAPSATPAATQAAGGTTAEPAAHGGFGLVAMRQRVEALGGTFTVESAPGEGTVIAVNLPAELPAGPAGAAGPPAVAGPPAPMSPRSLDARPTDATTDAATDATSDPTTADPAGRSVAGTRP